ncbi:retrotransposon protein, putative, ty1-copia subclass [Tanacetum coccineum]
MLTNPSNDNERFIDDNIAKDTSALLVLLFFFMKSSVSEVVFSKVDDTIRESENSYQHHEMLIVGPTKCAVYTSNKCLESYKEDVARLGPQWEAHWFLDSNLCDISGPRMSTGTIVTPGEIPTPCDSPSTNVILESSTRTASIQKSDTSVLENLRLELEKPVRRFTQTYRVNYKEMFSLVADIRDIRIIIAIVAFYDYEIWKLDVKTAFLNGYHDEDIYMVQPKGFVHPKHPRKVCKLQRSIYGLKQASRSWNKRFDKDVRIIKVSIMIL